MHQRSSRMISNTTRLKNNGKTWFFSRFPRSRQKCQTRPTCALGIETWDGHIWNLRRKSLEFGCEFLMWIRVDNRNLNERGSLAHLLEDRLILKWANPAHNARSNPRTNMLHELWSHMVQSTLLQQTQQPAQRENHGGHRDCCKTVTWCEALSSGAQVSEINASSSKWARPFGNPDFKNQVVSKEQFSIQIIMIFKIDSNCAHPRFWIRALMMDNRHDVKKILKSLRNATSWNQVL